MFASLVIVVLGILVGSLSIVVQYTKDRERRQKIERAASIPVVLALYGAIFWLMSHAHHLDDLGISPLALVMAIAFFLLIPAVTYVFSPAFKDAGDDSRHLQVHSQNFTTQPAQWIPYPQRPTASPAPCRSVVAVCTDDTFIIDGVVVDEVEQRAPFLLE